MNKQETSGKVMQAAVPKRAGEFVTLRGGGYSPGLMFDAFWREGELALMFGAAGVGKSLLAVQVADALAGPSPIEGFRMSRSRYKVLYIDLRHSDRQFAERYSYWRPVRDLGSVRKTCKFARNLYRSRPPAGEELCAWLGRQIAEHGFSAVVVDDLTALKKTHDGVREMLAAMRGLKRLCDELRVSVLAIAGSEEPPLSRQVSERDLKRASALCDVADTVFAIGRSRGRSEGGRFILQTRSRNAPVEWTEHNAPTAQIAQTAKGGPGFVFDKRFAEPVDPEVREACCRIRAMRQAGQTWRVIEAELGIPKTRAVRLFKKWTPEMNAEFGMRNAESGKGNAEGGMRNAESGRRNAECGMRDAQWEDENEDSGLTEAIEASLTKTVPADGSTAAEIPHSEFRVPHFRPLIPHSAFRTPHSNQLPHSALRVPHSNEIPDSALRVPHLRHGPHRVALCDLKRGTDRAGEEIFIQSEEEHTRRPLIWYKRDRRGNTSKFVRDGWGSTASNLGPSAFL